MSKENLTDTVLVGSWFTLSAFLNIVENNLAVITFFVGLPLIIIRTLVALRDLLYGNNKKD